MSEHTHTHTQTRTHTYKAAEDISFLNVQRFDRIPALLCASMEQLRIHWQSCQVGFGMRVLGWTIGLSGVVDR